MIGHQFWWEFRYPKLGIVTANELHVPVSDPRHPTPTYLEMSSADTDHSFWVPQLAGKTDVIPNRVNVMWIDPESPGLYLGQCAQYCGVQHAKMLLRVYAQSQGDFDTWVGATAAAGQAGCVHRGRPRGVSAQCLYQLSYHRWNRRDRAVWPGSHAPCQPGHDRVRSSPKHAGESKEVDRQPRSNEARLFDAGDAFERSRSQRCNRIPHNTPLIWPTPSRSPDAIDLTSAPKAASAAA